jgi:CHAD domain-containing protein
MATKTEVERKYDVPVDFALPDLSGVKGVAKVGDPAEHRLDATYYDTPGLRLAAHEVTLRRRTGGDDAGWHLKRPAGGSDRTETQVPLNGHAGDVPGELAAPLRALSRGEALAPVARVRTRRLERPLRDSRGRVIALLADDVVASEAPGEQAVLQEWRELEVELVGGSRNVLDALDVALRAAGARPSQSPSKLARALADRYPGGPERDDGVAGAYLRRQRDAILDNDPGARAGDPDAVHDMRVAARRLRSTLRTFRPLLDADRTEPLRAELRWLGAVLGAVRDGDVMDERLSAAVAAEPPELVVGPVAAQIHGRLASRTSKARKQLVKEFDGPRYAALLDAIDELVEAAPLAGAKPRRLRRLAGKALRGADRRMEAADRADDRPRGGLGGGDRNARLHHARKGYKRARYAVEAVAPLAGKPARRLAKRLTALQDVLGTHQDSIVTGELLRDYGMRAHLDGDNAFTYGLLHARQHEAGERSLADLADARRRAGRPKLRRWTRR